MADHDKSVAFEIKYDNGRPVELSDLGESFRALGRQYEEYVNRAGFDQQPSNAKLYIAEVRAGSIIVVLKNLLEPGSMVLKDIDVQ
jgi:hypothetical protein